jgi:translation initiation factor 2 alpha subunit (eIF-2alpha)
MIKCIGFFLKKFTPWVIESYNKISTISVSLTAVNGPKIHPLLKKIKKKKKSERILLVVASREKKSERAAALRELIY